MSFNSPYAVFITCLIVLSATGYGFRFLAFGREDSFKSVSLNLTLAFGIGTGFLSLSILLLGLTGMLALPFMILLLLGGFFIGGPLLYRRIVESSVECRMFLRRIQAFKLCAVVICVFALLNGLAALAPPLDIDVLNYHLAAPNVYTQHQRIIQLPGSYHSYFPFNIQMLYTLCLVLKSSLAAQCLHVVFGLANLVLIGGIASCFYGPKTAILAATLFYTIADVGGETPLARIDLGVSFYALLAFLCLLKAQDAKEKRVKLLMLSGIIGGVCAGSKYTALIVPVLLSVHIVLLLPETSRRKMQLAALVAMVTAIFASPWYFRNYFWTGNPVFPFLSSVFGTGSLPEEAISHIQQGNWNYAPIPRTLKNFVLTPWLLLVQREAFSSNRLGPLFLAYLPLGLLLGRHHLKRLLPLLLFCLLWASFWFWTSPLIRFFFAPLGLLSIILAQILRIALRYNSLWRVLTLNFLALWLTFMLGWNMKYHAPLALVAIGIRPPESVFERHNSIEGYQYADFSYINTTLKPEKVLLFGSKGLYLQRPFVSAADWGAKHWTELQNCDEQGVRAALEADGITHIMSHRLLQGANSREARIYQCWNAMRDTLQARAVYTREATTIFFLSQEGGPH